MFGTRSRARARLSSVGTGVALTVLAVLALAVAPALAARGHVFTGSFGSPGSGPGQLGEPAGLAVNETTGDIYYLDKINNRVEIFNSTGSKFEGEFNGSGVGLGMLGSGQLLNEGKAAGSGGLPEEIPTGRFDEPVGIAVDNDLSSPSFGDVYVADTHGRADKIPGEEVVDKFSASGEYIGQITHNPDGEPYSEDGFRDVFGVAVDPRGEVWVEEENFGSSPIGAASYTNAVANLWSGFSGTPGFVAAPGLAVDSQDDLYVHTIFGAGYPHEDAITEFSSSGATIRSDVDEEVPTGVAVEVGSNDVNDVYVSHLSNVHRLDATGKSLESLTVPGGHGSSVAVDASKSKVYVADSAAGVVDMFGPEAPGVPTVSAGSESVKDVTATSASLSGEVNPRSEPFEEATSYSFVYGPCDTPTTCASSPYVDSLPAPAGTLAANYEPDVVSAHPQDLVAHTAYHMRLVAHNSHAGVAEGEELTFTTQASGVFALSDGRQWELVSPPNKYGALIEAWSHVSQASVAGDAIAYWANAPIESQPPGSNVSIVQALAGRTAAGWRSANINAPHETATGASVLTEYPFFSVDLSGGLVQPDGAFIPSLSAEASAQTPFLRTDFSGGNAADICTSSCYTPLVTDASGVGNVPPGTAFGSSDETGGECISGPCGPQFVGASPDLSHIVLQYKWAPLVEGAPLGSLYEWAGGRLSVVSILPDETPATGGSLGSHNVVRNTVSADGSRVVWSYGSHLYLRDTVKEKTIQLDEVQGGTGTGVLGGPAFQTASSDGSRVFFIDSQRLTKDADSSVDLYECEIVEEAGELKCKLTDLTAGAGETAGVLGLVPGVSEDGAYAYFVDNGVLSGTQANERGETAIAGQPDLYVRHAGVTRLVSVLSSEDWTDWNERSEQLGSLTARVSPDGRWFAFMSERSLTGFDNRDETSGKRDQEVFLYHAGEAGEGNLVCASCDPTGGRPHGYVQEEKQGGGLGPGQATFVRTWVAGMLPGWTSPFYQSRYLSDSGRLFFNSYDALVPQDTNSAEDVYQFEPPGVGGCTETSTMFVVGSGGCIGLVSSGTSKDGSAFLDASESGGDIFFLTNAQLSPLDIDSALDIYDAHECAVGEDCSPTLPVPVPACEGDACQSAIAAPEDPTPGSLTYQGPGNPPPALLSAKPTPKSKPVKCKRNTVKHKGRCLKAKKRAKKAKRSNRRGK